MGWSDFACGRFDEKFELALALELELELAPETKPAPEDKELKDNGDAPGSVFAG